MNAALATSRAARRRVPSRHKHPPIPYIHTRARPLHGCTLLHASDRCRCTAPFRRQPPAWSSRSPSLSHPPPRLLHPSEGEEVLPEGLDSKVVEVYQGVGKVMSRYTAGKVRWCRAPPRCCCRRRRCWHGWEHA